MSALLSPGEALAAVTAIHDRTHWCFDTDEQDVVYEHGTQWWPCPTLNAVLAVERFSIHDDLTCHEGVTRRGEFQPCEKTATAFRYDDEGAVYPVCARHSRREMVPLSLARFYLSTRRSTYRRPAPEPSDG